MAESVQAKLIELCQEVSLTEQISNYLQNLNQYVMGDAYEWLISDPEHVFSMIQALSDQNVMIPHSFKISTSRWLWNCERNTSASGKILFYKTRGNSDDDTLMSAAVGIEALAESLFAELHRNGGKIEFKWEPFTEHEVLPDESAATES